MAKIKNGNEQVNRTILNEAVDAILSGMEHMQKEQREERKKELQELKQELKLEIHGVSEQVENLDEKVDANYKNTDGKIKAIKTTSVSREEFEDLKEEVYRLKKSFASG